LILLVLAALAEAMPESGFEPWFVEREVSVSRTRAPDAVPWVRAIAELPVSAAAVYDVVTDYGSYRELFEPLVARAAVLESSGESARIHLVWDYPFPFRRRDAIVAYTGQPLADGGFHLAWRDDARPTDPRSGVRIEHVRGETRIEPLARDRCRVTYTYLGDLGGSFPRAFEETAWRHEPLGYVLALRRRLNLPVPPK
jgi:hypothetical protein